MPPKKQQLDQSAWLWAEDVEPASVTSIHMESAYRINLKPCKLNTCRRNCKGNPRCVNALGEGKWFTDIPDSVWHEIDDPENERREKNAFAGLKNLGATCYVNTFLQVWFHNPEIRKAVFNWQEATDKDTLLFLKQDLPTLKNSLPAEELEKLLTPQDICGHLQNVFALLQFSKRRYIDPTPFINCLGLDAGLQQDAQEFSKLFMSLLEDTLYQQQNAAARTFTHHFMGEYHYVTRCSSCNSESRRPSNFYELDLNIKGHKNLNDCIGEFLKEENLDGDNMYMCSSCASKQNATRCIKLRTLPKVLNLQLLRFVFDRKTVHKKKLNTYIEFPETLDMIGYLGKSETNAVYDLAAVLIHRGPSAHSGHYVAHIKDPASKIWYKCNDEEIEKMGGKNLQLGNEDELEGKGPKKPKVVKGSHASRNAYMLVYHLQSPQNHCTSAASQLPLTSTTLTSNQVTGTSYASSIVAESAVGVPSSSTEETPASTTSESLSMAILPLRIQRYLEFDNDRFEDWVNDIKCMRDQNVSKGQARQSEVKEIYNMLPWDDGDAFNWVTTEWLTKFMTSDSAEQVPEINNSCLMCSHQKLDPDKVPKSKCISRQVADILYSRYGGKNKLDRNSICAKCVKERCHVIRTKTRMNEDSKAITAFTKLKEEVINPQHCFWVGKSSLRSWKRLALEQLQQFDSTGIGVTEDGGVCNGENVLENGHVNSAEGNCQSTVNYCDTIPTTSQQSAAATTNSDTTLSTSQYQSTLTVNHWDSDRTPNTSPQSPVSGTCSSQPSSSKNHGTQEDSLQFNDDILCERHNSLTIEGGSRRLVPEDIWVRLKRYFPNAPEYRGDAQVCSLCQAEVQEEQQLKSLNKAKASEQKTALSDLYLDKKRPTWVGNSVSLNVVTVDFLEEWRKFIRDPTRCASPQTTDNGSLLCPHGGFLYNPDTIGLDDASKRLYLLYPYEWTVLKNYTQTDVEVTLTRIQEDSGHVTCLVNPDICQECQEAREYEELKSKLNYRDAVIFVRKLTPSGKTPIGNGSVDSGTEGDTYGGSKEENGSKDADFMEESSSKRRKSCSEDGTPSTTVVESFSTRRSTRHRKVRGEKEVVVSSTQTLRDLKLQEDEPVEDASFLDDVPKSSNPEKGFKGTGLLSR